MRKEECNLNFRKLMKWLRTKRKLLEEDEVESNLAQVDRRMVK